MPLQRSPPRVMAVHLANSYAPPGGSLLGSFAGHASNLPGPIKFLRSTRSRLRANLPDCM